VQVDLPETGQPALEAELLASREALPDLLGGRAQAVDDVAPVAALLSRQGDLGAHRAQQPKRGLRPQGADNRR
jgi:hypothetical protein